MKREKAKQKAVAAIRDIVEAAKELAKAEHAYYGKQPRNGEIAKEFKGEHRSTVLGGTR